MQYGYEVTWNRGSAEMPKIIPDAENGRCLLEFRGSLDRFLTSPLDMRRFVDQFHSKHIAVHFDVGDLLQYGFPEDWIMTLGNRIRRVHSKITSFMGFKWVNLYRCWRAVWIGRLSCRHW